MCVAVLLRACAALGVAGIALAVAATPATAGPSHQQISGTGSSWSEKAVQQWISDVSQKGLQLDFTGSGSAQGRKDFANGVTDFGVTDIGYQGKDSRTGEDDTNCIPGNPCRAFAYEPIVAGGTSFPYQLRVAGKLVKNLRLSGQTVAKIFTYKITNWNDPQIAADNNGHRFPSLPIIPVEHSEGSGSTAQFTTYLNTQYPSIWQPFLGRNGFTEYYPPPTGGQSIQQNGSDGVMNFIRSAAGNGAIGYDEYAYPKAVGFPVAKLLNSAGYYTLPDQYNVAVALKHAVINMDKSSPNYLLQTLNGVYVAPEKQAYAMSSYSYILVPTGANDPRMKGATAKRQTLADYLYYAVCQGQQEMGPIGYSPLPINLVQASFAQTAKLKAADPKVDLTARDVSTCKNPTFVAGHPEINRLAQIAPQPPACDKQGAGPCSADGTPTAAGGGGTSGGGQGGSAGGGRGGGAGAAPGTVPSGGAAVPGAAGGAVPAGTTINPDTGQVVGATGTGAGTGGGDVQPQPAELAAYRAQNMTGVLAPLAVLEILAVLVFPPVLYFVVLRRRRTTS